MHFTFYLGDSSRIGLNLQFNSDVKSGLSVSCELSQSTGKAEFYYTAIKYNKFCFIVRKFIFVCRSCYYKKNSK